MSYAVDFLRALDIAALSLTQAADCRLDGLDFPG